MTNVALLRIKNNNKTLFLYKERRDIFEGQLCQMIKISDE